MQKIPFNLLDEINRERTDPNHIPAVADIHSRGAVFLISVCYEIAFTLVPKQMGLV